MRRLALVCLLTACGGGEAANPDATALPAWNRELPPSDVMGSVARGIIHLHSPYSHDACDGNPRGDTEVGPIDEACYQNLREGLCATRQDFAALTDHDASMAEEEFATLFLERADDEMVGTGASRIHCDNGHDVLLTVGGENDLMPIMLDQHVPGDAQQRHDTYNGRDATAVTAFRDAGATVWIPHTEGWTADEVATLAPDGIEVYQLHANLDPDIRPTLGLDPYEVIDLLAQFVNTTEDGPQSDLALLAVLEPNPPALAVWDNLLGRGMHVSGSGGTDAHQNVLNLAGSDGERIDSYRRMMRWFTNVVQVADASDPAQIETALRGGAMYVAFELMGTPVGFEMPGIGSTVAVGETLHVTLPTVHDLDPELPAPVITGKVIRVTATGSEVIAEGAGPFEIVMDVAGAYRVEVDIQPLHLGPYLGNLETNYAERTLPWIYTSPIYVE
jgi:hypothetical protein